MMSTYRCLKKILLAVFVIGYATFCKAQAPRYAFTSEIIPFLYFPEQGSGDGFQVGISRTMGQGKYKIHLTYEANKYTYRLSGDYEITVGGINQFIKKTDESIFTPSGEKGVEGVPDLSLYEELEKAGFKHFSKNLGIQPKSM